MKFTPRLNPATKTSVMIKPTESALEIERGLYESKFCILSLHDLVTAFFDRSIDGFVKSQKSSHSCPASRAE